MTKQIVHFIGIGGIGTSALSRWFLEYGWQVSGSDAVASPITQELKKQGIRVSICHQAKNVPQEVKLVIYSSAVPLDNPELKKAKKLRIITKSYAEALGDLTKQYKTLAVTGAHGKSTATSLLSLVLIKAGFDPTVIIGTKLKEFGNSNFKNGKGDYLVLEADEYHGSFLNYSPFAAIITNIDREHLDYYKNLGAIKNTFLKFINSIRPNGILVVNKDDKNLFSLKNKIQKIARKKKIKIIWYDITNFVDRRNLLQLRKILKIIGEHNVSNALAVYTLAKALKIKDKDIFNAISRYRGAWRRMEYRGKLKVKSSKLKVDVYDDYAHHPTEIKATLSGIAQKWPKSCLICVFQPHQAQRLSALFRDFVGAFDSANFLILLDVYQVAGRDNLSQNRGCCNENKFRRKTSSRFCNAINIVAKSLSSHELAEAISKRLSKSKNIRLKKVIYLPRPEELPQVLATLINADIYADKRRYIRANLRINPRKSAFIVVMMGAGDIYNLTNKLVR